MPVRSATLRRRVFGIVAVATVTMVSGRGSADAPRLAVVAPPANAVAHRYYPEVRLRKLHLVRPDLIPFPIDFDVFC